MHLPKTKLSLEGGKLTKYDATGNVVSSFPIEDIQGVSMKDRYEFLAALIFIVPSTALAYLCRTKVESELWAWSGTIVFATIALIGVLGIKGRYIEVKTNTGDVMYPVNDAEEDASGFMIALQRELNG